MQRVLEVSSTQRPQVLIEIDETRIETISPSGYDGDVALEGGTKEAVEKLGQIGESIAEACRSINDAVANGLKDSRPDEFTLEFGVKVGAQGGMIISKVTGEAALKVTATWRAESAPAS